MKHAYVAMMVLVVPATTSCTEIVGIDGEYHVRGGCGDHPIPVTEMPQDGANYIAVDATNIYWTNRWGGQVMKMAIDGGAPIAIATGQQEPRCIAVDKTHVYWTNIGDGTVMRVGIDGTNLTALATDQLSPYDIAVDDVFVYWTNEGTVPTSTDGDVRRRRLDLSEPAESLAPPSPYPAQQYPQSIVVDKEGVYWTNAYQVMKVGLDGSMPTILGSFMPPKVVTQFSRIAVNGESVFWTNTDENSVKRVGKTGGDEVKLAASSTPFSIAVDATSVYWTSSGGGTVWKVGIGGGTAEKLAEDQPWPVGIAVDETCIYWANRDNDTVMKLAK